ncbi:hypothetical protein ACJQ40_000171 [Enterococcus faecium]
MFKQNAYITAHGSFVVKAVNEEYVELDSFEKGHESAMEIYSEKGLIELNSDGTKKEFDGFSVGDFFQLNGKYKVVRSNSVFTKIELEDYMLSLPNHKLEEVK